MPSFHARPLDAEDNDHLASLFQGAVSHLRDEYSDEEDLMEAVVGRVVRDIDRLRDAGDTWALRWTDRVAELALLRLAESRLQG